MTRAIPPDPSDFEVPALNAGQMVTVAYASKDGRLWRLTVDRAAPGRAPRYAFLEWADIGEGHPAAGWESAADGPPPITEGEWEAWEPASLDDD